MITRYATTKSIDGTSRVSFKVDLRMTLEDMAVHLVDMNPDFGNCPYGDLTINGDLIDKTVTSRTWVIAAVGDSVRKNGNELLFYVVNDAGHGAVVERVLKRLEEIWSN